MLRRRRFYPKSFCYPLDSVVDESAQVDRHAEFSPFYAFVFVLYPARRQVRDIAFRWNAFKQRSYVEFANAMPNPTGRCVRGNWIGGVFKYCQKRIVVNIDGY